MGRDLQVHEEGGRMVLSDFDIRRYLLESSEEFSKLSRQHSDYDEKLLNLLRKNSLSEEEKLEEVNLKKLKLRVKDQMEEMIQAHRNQGGSEVPEGLR